MITEPGIYLDMSPAEYFSDPCADPSLTQSIAKILIDQTPAHARLEHPRLRPQGLPEREEYRAERAIGNAAHLIMIGRGKRLQVVEADSWRKKADQEARDEAWAMGLEPILAEHYDRAGDMVAAAREQLAELGWSDAFETGNGEVVLAWRDDDAGWCRTMIDWMTSTTVLYDYKTSGGSFAPHGLGLKVEGDGWHIQGAMHERGLNALDPKNAGRRKFRFVAQENFAPYALVGVELDEHWLTMGRKKLAHAMRIWREAVTSKHWPAYPPFPVTPEYPGFRETAWLDREAAAEHARTHPRLAPDHLMAG